MEAGLQHRFWSKVDRGSSDACWPWIACRGADGYGLFRADVCVRAHRVAFEMVNGKIPAGLLVRHKCDNRPCCNPAHLVLGTPADNNADRVERGRSSVGERQANAKLTEEAVREVRRLYPSVNVVTLARRYRVSHVTMWKAIHRKTWRHVA